ncbi:hypothetical protein PAHAL_5G059100 [Panicum hallii]|uniref:Uncharacterized protein n=1 Tax=Panicum hallii TaxID=206008 RepID=A0A2S3HP47_9POAL|nr:hypothetical protein PAHAL_5G059100 [Panicum hallii]
MSNTMVLDLFNAMTAANSSRGHYEDDYEELLVPRMITIKPAYRWAIRGFATTCAIMLAIGIITLSEGPTGAKIAGVVIIICSVWCLFVVTADAVVYRFQRRIAIPDESMV